LKELTPLPGSGAGNQRVESQERQPSKFPKASRIDETKECFTTLQQLRELAAWKLLKTAEAFSKA
jgi:hypothetical protein